MQAGFPLYVQENLDDWALTKISPPVRSTSEKKIGGRGMTGAPGMRSPAPVRRTVSTGRKSVVLLRERQGAGNERPAS